MEGILLGSGAFSTILPVFLGLLVLLCGFAGISLGHASDPEYVDKRAHWAEWLAPEVTRPIWPEPETSERPEEEKEHIRKAA